jgi:hypothetical protein
VEKAAPALGLSENSLRRWQAATKRKSGARAAVRRVEIQPQQADASASVVVHAPGGLRIEGLDMARLAELVRRLG